MTPEIAPWRLIRLKSVLAEQGVVAYPTEGVWGLGCLPESEKAVHKLLKLKQRPVNKGLVLVAACIQQFSAYLEALDESSMSVLRQHWPGPVTFLVPHNGTAPPWIVGAHKTVALRVSAHPLVREICLAVNSPLVSTSANPANHPPARDVLQVRRYFGSELDAICPGNLGNAEGPSEIRDLHTSEIVRSGGTLECK